MTEYRFVISLGLAMLVGSAGLQVWPFPVDHPLLELIAVRRPAVYAGFLYGYATVWFTTPFLVINIFSSFAYIFVARADRAVRRSPPAPWPRASTVFPSPCTEALTAPRSVGISMVSMTGA